MVARVCLSDLHLGDSRSVFSVEGVADHVAEDLANLTDGHIEQLVLNGDLWEECVPANMQDRAENGFVRSVLMASQAFFSALREHIRIGEVVWVPGNHDLSLWARMVGEYRNTAITGMAVQNSTFADLGIRNFLKVAYPVFMPTPGAAHVLFTHGHLMDLLVRGKAIDPEYAALAILGCPRAQTPVDGGEVRSLFALAQDTDRFSLALWKRYSSFEAKYQEYILRRNSRLANEPMAKASDRLNGKAIEVVLMVEPDKNSKFPEAPWFLTASLVDPSLPTPVHGFGGQKEPMCFVYGHDHLGNQADVPVCDETIRVVSSGGWTSEYSGHRPHSRALIWEKADDVFPRVWYVSTPALS